MKFLSKVNAKIRLVNHLLTQANLIQNMLFKFQEQFDSFQNILVKFQGDLDRHESALFNQSILINSNSKNTKIQEALGRIESRQLALQDKFNLSDNEFSVFSQWGEDGIIQFLLRYVEIPNKIFVEFGVENYIESNTRFLLVNNNLRFADF